MIDFDKLINNYLVRKSKPRTIGRYYPSEVGRCIRKSWYTFKYPLPVDDDLQKIFQMGNLIHDFVTEVLKSERTEEVELVDTELPLEIGIDDFIISGRIDNIVIVKAKDTKCLVEVKSNKNLNYVKEAKHDNEMQLQLYMYATGIHNGILLYIQKNDLKSKVFDIPYNQEIVDEAVGRFRTLHAYLVTDCIPPAEARETKEMKWMCNYCEYKTRCREDDGIKEDGFDKILNNED